MFPAPQPQMQAAAQPQDAGSPLARVGAAAQGAGSAPNAQQTLAMYQQKVQSIAQALGDLVQIQSVIDPEGSALIRPMAEAGKALEQRIQGIIQRQSAGPGAPSAQQALGGGSPAQNPSEGQAPPAVAA